MMGPNLFRSLGLARVECSIAFVMQWAPGVDWVRAVQASVLAAGEGGRGGRGGESPRSEPDAGRGKEQRQNNRLHGRPALAPSTPGQRGESGTADVELLPEL